MRPGEHPGRFCAPGSGAVVRFDLLTEIVGEPLPSPR